jgi:hypothetical protein
MVEVFATNINTKSQADQVRQKMVELFPGTHINFDVDDCDHILRMEGKNICVTEIMQWLQCQGVVVRVLD